MVGYITDEIRVVVVVVVVAVVVTISTIGTSASVVRTRMEGSVRSIGGRTV